jgi:2-oxoglutarate ferredoxin oxidoreductase subunit delta
MQCVAFCPSQTLKISNDINELGYHYPEVKDEDKCSYCGMCEFQCPDFAIFIAEERFEGEFRA